ncbi:hypothetical protein VTN02DRAFT_6246 [Thermoascus thermophilus]
MSTTCRHWCYRARGVDARGERRLTGSGVQQRRESTGGDGERREESRSRSRGMRGGGEIKRGRGSDRGAAGLKRALRGGVAAMPANAPHRAASLYPAPLSTERDRDNQRTPFPPFPPCPPRSPSGGSQAPGRRLPLSTAGGVLARPLTNVLSIYTQYSGLRDRDSAGSDQSVARPGFSPDPSPIVHAASTRSALSRGLGTQSFVFQSPETALVTRPDGFCWPVVRETR